VKTIESLTSGGGSKLGFTCRSCERNFGYTTVNNKAWATSTDGLTLSDEVTLRWLAECCPGHRVSTDDDDRQHLKKYAH
jgi:hypothetical protein